jgi:hypothetical protein
MFGNHDYDTGVPMTTTSEEVARKIQAKTDLIVKTMEQRGSTICPADALHLARRLHQLETPLAEEVKENFRQRYTQQGG